MAALIADSFGGPISVPTLVSLSAVALVLDAVDGWVARRTGTVSSLGARFDMEVDAFLILVLSVYVARLTGDWWVLTIGAARYVFVAVGRLQPWLRGSAATAVLAQGRRGHPGHRADRRGGRSAARLVVRRPPWLGALALLAESFGRDVWWCVATAERLSRTA